jgi:heterodisulfide reductase subunit A
MGTIQGTRRNPIKDSEVDKEQIEQLYKSLTGRNFGDVLVVGGGISGIQAALDLGTAGFKVFLVDKAPSIGGHMAQLDKTFPTNDCSL